MEMANLTDLIVKLHQSTNEKYRKDKKSIDELDYLQQVNELHEKLEDLRDQYRVFWENYEKRNRKYWAGEKLGSLDFNSEMKGVEYINVE
jgi:predicted phage gp36 major capsid-like protein